VRFQPGRILATAGSLKAMEEAGVNPALLLERHLSGDWGDLCHEDRAENELSLKEGFRLLSCYTLTSSERIWLITEEDRSATTFLLPSEY